MADNVQAETVSVPGVTFATDDVGGTHYPITKLAFGALDSVTLASSGNGTTDAGTIRVTISSDTTGVLSVDDNGGSLTIDGTVTANLSATDNAVLDSIDTNTATTAAAVTDLISTNNSTTTPLGGGLSFTGTGDDCEGYSAVTVTIYADVDSATDGMTFQFSTDNTNWDDVYTFTMDVSASDTRRFQFPVTAQYFRVVYTNGAGAQSAFRVQTMLHSQNVLTSIHRLVDDMSQDRSAQVVKAVLFGKGQGGSPDFKPIDVTNGGNLKVAIEEEGVDLATQTTLALVESNTQQISNIQVDTDLISTSVQLIDNTIFLDGAAFGAGSDYTSVIGFVYDDTTPTPLVEDKAGYARVSANRNQYVQLRDGAGNERGANVSAGGSLQVDVSAALPAGTNAIGKLADNSGVDIGDVDILSIAAGDNNIGNVDIASAIPAGDNNIGNVDIVTLPASTNTIEVVGDEAHDAPAAGNPVAIGARATNAIESLTQVAAADATFVTSDLNGCLVTRPHTTLEETVSYHVVNTAGTELAVTGLGVGGAGVHNYITTVIVHNAHDTTNGYIQLLDGSGGTVLMTVPAPATGGSVVNLTVPLKQTTANTALYWDASAAITTLYVTIIGFQAQG